MNTISLELLSAIIDNQEKLMVIFHNDEIILTNLAFNNFFGVGSTQEFNSGFGKFIDNFVPHPSYFHKEKILPNESWFDAILKLPLEDRMVSMITRNFDPHAFSVEIDRSVDAYKIVSFEDITQSLVKRIMIENHANMDEESGAYAREYFNQIARSYQDAALFNEKTIAMILITLNFDKEVNISSFTDKFKNIIRHDDMLVRWDENRFLLIYLAEPEDNAKKVLIKLRSALSSERFKEFEPTLELSIQENHESITSLIERVNS